MMHGKILRKLLPLVVSASLLMGTSASVMAEDLENTSFTEETVIELETEASSEGNVEEFSISTTFQDEDIEEEKEALLEDDKDEETIPSSNENADASEGMAEESQKYKVKLKESYPHVEVHVSGEKSSLPIGSPEAAEEEDLSGIFDDENLILVTVDNENADHLVTDNELTDMMTDSFAEEDINLIPANNGITELEYLEGETVYISAVAEDDYIIRDLFLSGDNGERVDVEVDPVDGICSFVMPSFDLNLEVQAENAEDIVTTDLSETEIEALEKYMEEQGIYVSRGAMLLAAASSSVKTITFNMNGFISYSAEGYGSGMDAMFYISTANYKGNGNGYCLNPAVQAPGHASQGTSISYTTTVYDYTDPMLLKIMYYGFGGPADITGSYASTPTARHILTHMVAVKRAKELGISGAGDYTYRANSTAISKADALYNAIKAKPDINGTVSILTPVAGQQTIMLLSSYSIPETKGKLKIKKTSAKVELSNGNPNYSLEGAKYRVYKDQALTAPVASFITDANGDSETTMSLDPGTYYVKEVIAPKGYLVDETIYSVTVKAGQTSTVAVKEMPANDPLSLILEKVDAVTGTASQRLQGAKFAVKFYPVENEADMNQPQYSWIFQTDENGRIRMDDAHKVSGDNLIKGETGATLVPLGFLTIQETEAPEGYLINDTRYVCQVMKESNTVRTTNLPTGENAVREQPANTEISITKTVTGSAGNKNKEFNFSLALANSEGTSIAIPGELVCSITENGSASEDRTVTARNGVFTFTLHHGQTATFKEIPAGVEYVVKELDGTSNGYTVTNEESTGVTTTEAVQINIINHKDMTIPTGADTNRNIMFMMTAVCVGLIFLFAGYRLVRRKK